MMKHVTGLLKGMNSRRWLILSLLTVLSLLIFPLASAANLELFTTMKDATSAGSYYQPGVQSAARVGNSLWFLSSEYDGIKLYCWNQGDADVHQVGGTVAYSMYYASMEDMEMYGEQGLDTDHAFSFLFSDGERLLSMNSLTGKVFAVREESGALVYEDVPAGTESGMFELGDVLRGDETFYINSIHDCRMQGDDIKILISGWSEGGAGQIQRLVTLSMKDGSIKTVDMEVSEACITDDGVIYGIWRDEMNAYDEETGEVACYSLMKVDPETGKAEEMYLLPHNSVSGMAYSSSLGCVVYLQGSRIMAASLDGQVKQVGFTPMQMYNPVLMEVNGQMLCASYAGVYLRDVSMSFAADRQLTIYGYYNNDAIRKFSQEEPDVPVYTPGTYYNGADKLLEAMKNGDMDIIGMNITYESFVSLRDHGYCLNLESDDVPAEVREYGNRLYPVFRDQLCYKGNLVALPTNAYSYDGIAYFREAIEEAGFAMEDMPTNMLDLIRFLSEWDDDYAEDNPDFMPLRTYGDIRASMIDQVIQRYINYCKGHDEMISFSSPLFRELMEAVMQMHTNNTVQMPTMEDEDDEDAWDAYYQIRPLMELEYSLLGSFDESEGYVVRPISLKDGLEPETYANMNVVFINPYSSHISDALKFLSSVVETVHGTTNEYIFCSDMEEPLLNPNYDMIIHGYQESLESYQKIAEQAEDEESRQQAEEILEEIREGLNNTEQFRYLITEDELKHYKEDILPIVKVAQRTFLYSTESDTTTELNSLISRLRDGQMTLDQFIHDADGKLRMMQLEDE